MLVIDCPVCQGRKVVFPKAAGGRQICGYCFGNGMIVLDERGERHDNQPTGVKDGRKKSSSTN